jgi:hypothetical protein
MAAKKTNPAMEFLVDALKADREAVYKDVAAAAAKKKLKVYPIMWGRAKALLGYVKVAPRGQGKVAKAKAKAKAKAATGTKRGPGRPPKAGGSLESALEGIAAAVRTNERARDGYRSALTKIAAIISATLG